MAMDAEKTSVSLRVPVEICDAFDQVATVLERDRTWVMLRAFRHYLASEGAYILTEAEGLAALDRGEGVDFDDVMNEIDDIIDRAEQRPAPRQVG